MAPSASRCAMCGMPLGTQRITREVKGITYEFDKEQCELFFMKLESVYGKGFFEEP